MKIVFFTTGMTKGGAERVIATLSNELTNRGHDVAIVMLKGCDSAYVLSAGVRLISAGLKAGAKQGPSALKFYSKTIKQLNPDIVFAFALKANLLSCFAKLIGVKVPLVVSERADPFNRASRNQFLCNHLFHLSDGVVCQSKVVAEYYAPVLARKKIEVIDNPLDLSCVAETPSVNRAPYILSVGRLCKQKRQDLIIEAFAKISNDFPELRLKICGEGDDYNKLYSMCEQHMLSNRILFEGNVDNVMRVYSDAAAFVMTSDFEGFPNALIEAAASGIPCITTDFSPGIARDIILDGSNGYVVPCGDIEQLSGSLKSHLLNPIPYETLAFMAKKVRSVYSTDAVVEKWLKIANEVGGQTK